MTLEEVREQGGLMRPTLKMYVVCLCRPVTVNLTSAPLYKTFSVF